MRTVQLYVNDIRLDLFDDEKIEVTSTIQNIKDLSKTFTDFSQSFTVPASKVNNGVFDHYYNNDVNGTFIAKERAEAKIEINHTPFRVGKVQLEGAEIKNNQVESYRITFFGDVVTLKDKFGEDKLSDLDYSTIQTEYTGADILASLTSVTDDDVRYPLITSERIWTYGDTPATTDIEDSSSPIVYDELFPALRMAKILELIASKYSLVFTGNFLTDKKFTNVFTWWKNRKTPTFDLEPTLITFNDASESVFTTNEVAMIRQEPAVYTPVLYDPATTTDGVYTLEFIHDCNTTGVDYYIDVYVRNAGFTATTFYSTLPVFNATTTGAQSPVVALVAGNGVFANKYYSFKIRSTSVITLTNIEFKRTHSFDSNLLASPFTFANLTEEIILSSTDVDNPFTLEPYMDLSLSAPDMKIADYFSGMLSMFNLTCFPLQDSTTFQIEPLDVWYAGGGEVDITPYTIIDSIKVDRPKLHKAISFEYAKSKSFLNEEFEETFNRQYGSLINIFPYDGSELKVKLPFENLYFNRFTGTNLQVGYSTTEATSGKSYVPKVTNLYLDESTACSFQFNNGAATAEVTTYVPLGQDVTFNGENYSINFGLDVSTLKDVAVDNTLYQTYYEPYLLNLFDDKTRQVTVECIMPLSMLTMLTLDDAIILRDKKYRINEMKTDLTSGKVTLVLLSDWVKVNKNTTITNEPIPSGGGTICLPVKPIKPIRPTKPYKGGGGYVTLAVPLETPFVTGSPTLPETFTDIGEICFTVPVNSSGALRTNTIPVTYYNPDGTVLREDTLFIIQDYDKSYLLKEDGGYLLTENYDKIILE